VDIPAPKALLAVQTTLPPGATNVFCLPA